MGQTKRNSCPVPTAHPLYDFTCIFLTFQLGVDAAFDDGEFDQIIKDRSFRVSQIKHRAMVEVTRDGTEGAAASAIEIVPLSANVQLPKIINVDKPFLFFIRDTVLKTILFAGKESNLEPN